MKTLENNKLIAEFLNLTSQVIFEQVFTVSENGKTKFYKKDELEFHTDWNWLMQVVEKIESENIVCFKIQGNNCYCEGNFKYGITAPSKINAVYTVCVEFIKWYNNQNKVS